MNRLTSDTVTRDQLGDFIFDCGMELEEYHLDALWALMADSANKTRTIETFLRLLQEDDVAHKRMSADNLDVDPSTPWL